MHTARDAFADAIAGLRHPPPVILDNVDEGQISFFLYICPQSVKDDRAIDSLCFAPQIRPVGLISDRLTGERLVCAKVDMGKTSMWKG